MGAGHYTGRVLVIGAGPAGLLAALAAARQGARVTLADQMERPGVKLLATGGGRCNLTNTLGDEAFMQRFGRQGRFMQPALRELGSAGLRRLLGSLGVPTHSPDGLGVYPVSESAKTVQEALWRACREAGVAVRLGVKVSGLEIASGAVRGALAGDERLGAGRVVLATGGRGYPELGATGEGYGFARQAGHRIVEPVPALVPLLTRETWPRDVAGVALADVRLRVEGRGRRAPEAAGEMLFTHRGISGPAALNLSGAVAALLRASGPVALSVELAPGRAVEAWRERFREWGRAGGSKHVHNALAADVPHSLGHILCRQAGIADDTHAGNLPGEGRDRLIALLCAMPLTVSGTEGFTRAQVTRGGVTLKEVAPETLASRVLPGLYLAGELLDLDGPCGGYNLQWAFSSGWLAGLSAGSPGG